MMPVSETPHYHVFLSHNSRDKGSVEPLALMLREKGLNPFLDKWNLVPGEPIEDALIEALENSDSAVIFVGPGGEGPWQSEEMRDILKRAVKSHNEFRAIPVLLPEASAEALEKSFLGSRLWIEFKAVDDGDALERLAKAIRGEAFGDGSFTLPDEPAPYRGLERFERIERLEEDFFFGRDDEIRALVGRLVTERFVAVVGASGSGKSSLIRAGLSKQLAEEVHPGIRRWRSITVEPGGAPFRSLAVQVAVAAGIPIADREGWIEKTVEKWRASPQGVRESIEALFAGAEQPLLLFIDQFEELFTHRLEGQDSGQIARNFVANLVDLWRHGGDRVRVVLALRADFVERCLEIAPLKELLQDRTMLVGEVGDDALREIVKEPAARVGAFLEKGLMERILTEVRSQSGALPLLQHSLHQLWLRRRGAWLTHEAYDASGGVARALNEQAQVAYKSLDEAQRAIADSLFPRLITLGEGVSDTRRRVKRNELYPQGVEPRAVDAVIDKLSGKDARILVTTREGNSAEDLGCGEDFVEFTHEALLGNWERLVRLLDCERESIRKHRSLTAAATEWASKPAEVKPNFLLRAGQLVIAEQWATQEGGGDLLNRQERQFLEESLAERSAEEGHKAKIARRLKLLSIGASAAAVIALVFGSLAIEQKKKAAAERDETLHLQSLFLADAAQRELSNGDAVTGALLALEGLQDPGSTDKTQRQRPYVREAYFSLQSAWGARREQTLLGGHGESVSCAVFSPDGGRIATASEDNTARVWDAASGTLIHTIEGHTGQVWNVAFSPGGERIVTASQDRTARVWDAETGALVHTLNGHQDVVWDADFSPDGTLIATASYDKTVRFWDAVTWEPVRELRHGGGVYSVNFSRDGTRVVTACGDGKARIWEVATGEEGVTLSGHSDEVYEALFDAAGTRVVTASRDHTARLWDAQTGDETHLLKGHSALVNRAAFSPGGGHVLTASEDGTARFWDAQTGRVVQAFNGHGIGLRAASFSPDGMRAVTGSNDRTARIWEVKLNDTLSGHTDIVWSAVFGPGGSRILTASQDGSVRFWDAATGEMTQTLARDGDASVNRAVFSPDGTLLVTASVDQMARIWDVKSMKLLHTLQGHLDWVYTAVFNPDGTLVVSAGGKTARIWDVATGEQLHVLEGHEDWVYDAEFNHDGTRIATVSEDRTARVWDTASGEQLHKLTGHAAIFSEADFSPDGTRIVTASSDKTARVWDVGTGNELLSLVGHSGNVFSAAFSPDGTRIVTASADMTARVWNALTGGTIKVLQGHTGEVNSAAFSPDGSRIVTASADTTARIWDVTIIERQTLIDWTRQQTPRCLTPGQRTQFFLRPEPPAWCIEMGKWPYHTEEWQQWLLHRRAGKDAEMPGGRGQAR